MDESRAWPRYELVGGELLVTPAPKPMHQLAVANMLRALQNYVARVGLEALVLPAPADLELVVGTIVQPDVFVLPQPVGQKLRDWAAVRSLLLAVEILSPGSARVDRVTKRRFYTEAAAVAEYWVVDLEARVIERWLHGEHRPLVESGRMEWRPDAVHEPMALELDDWFGSVLD